jgi:hypothetical protein
MIMQATLKLTNTRYTARYRGGDSEDKQKTTQDEGTNEEETEGGGGAVADELRKHHHRSECDKHCERSCYSTRYRVQITYRENRRRQRCDRRRTRTIKAKTMMTKHQYICPRNGERGKKQKGRRLWERRFERDKPLVRAT